MPGTRWLISSASSSARPTWSGLTTRLKIRVVLKDPPNHRILEDGDEVIQPDELPRAQLAQRICVERFFKAQEDGDIAEDDEQDDGRSKEKDRRPAFRSQQAQLFQHGRSPRDGSGHGGPDLSITWRKCYSRYLSISRWMRPAACESVSATSAPLRISSKASDRISSYSR